MRKPAQLFTRTRGSNPDDFSGRVTDFFRRHRRERLRIASGFIGGGLWNALHKWGLHDARIDLLLGNIDPKRPVLSAELNRCLRRLSTFPGVNLKLDPSMHAKLFIAGNKAALFGSMNLSEPGLHRRTELLLETSDRRHVAEATKIFDIWWEQASWLSAATLRKVRISKRGSSTDQAGATLPVHGDSSAWKGIINRKPSGGRRGSKGRRPDGDAGSREQESSAASPMKSLAKLKSDVEAEPLKTHKVQVVFLWPLEKQKAWELLREVHRDFEKGTFDSSWRALVISGGKTSSLNLAYRMRRDAGNVS